MPLAKFGVKWLKYGGNEQIGQSNVSKMVENKLKLHLKQVSLVSDSLCRYRRFIIASVAFLIHCVS